MITFGERLKLLRNKKGLKQTELAKILEVSERTIRYYEFNEREPDLSSLKILADFFEVSIDYLLGRTDDPTPLSSVRAVAHMENKEDLNYEALQEILYKTLKKLHDMEKKE